MSSDVTLDRVKKSLIEIDLIVGKLKPESGKLGTNKVSKAFDKLGELIKGLFGLQHPPKPTVSDEIYKMLNGELTVLSKKLDEVDKVADTRPDSIQKDLESRRKITDNVDKILLLMHQTAGKASVKPSSSFRKLEENLEKTMQRNIQAIKKDEMMLAEAQRQGGETGKFKTVAEPLAKPQTLPRQDRTEQRASQTSAAKRSSQPAAKAVQSASLNASMLQNEKLFNKMSEILKIAQKGQLDRTKELPDNLGDNEDFMFALVSHDAHLGGLASARLKNNKVFENFISNVGSVERLGNSYHFMDHFHPLRSQTSATSSMQTNAGILQNIELSNVMTKTLLLAKLGRLDRKEKLPNTLGDNEAFMIALVSHDPYCAELASDRLKANKVFMNYAISLEGCIIQYVKGDLIMDRDIIAAARRAPSAYGGPGVVELHIDALQKEYRAIQKTK